MDQPVILIVEDHPQQQLVMSMLAEKAEVSARVVSSGLEALEALDRCPDYKLILMDWRLSGMDGLECTRRIRMRESAHGNRIPIIAVTANAMNGDREKCIEAGMDDYLSKPLFDGAVCWDHSALARQTERWLYSALVACEPGPGALPPTGLMLTVAQQLYRFLGCF